MTGSFLNRHFSVLFFVFATSVTCGLIFFGVLVGFGFMLAELGFKASTISSIFFATIAYSFKFVLSPIVKNYICKHNDFKMLAFALQIVIMLTMASLGLYTANSSAYIIFFNVLFVTTIGAFHDVIGDYVRLNYFRGKTIGVATSVGTVGFRIGMLLAGAGILYIAELSNWRIAFVIISSLTLLSTVATIFLPKITSKSYKQTSREMGSAKEYLKFFIGVLKKSHIFIVLLLTLSFKFPDSCINCLKSVFLRSKGIGKVDFANISQVLGVLVILLVGVVAGTFTYKMNIRKCMKIAFSSQIASSICFLLLSNYNCTFAMTAILVNISSFFLGFSAIVYRTYISQIANADVNTYTILLSIGSIGRTFSTYCGGYIVDSFSWNILYAACAIACIPGILACFMSHGIDKKINV